jgi:tetratricopeptide (TPR) repeat protein
MVRAVRALLTVETEPTPAPAEIHDLRAFRDTRHGELVAEARDELIRGDEETALELCLEALRFERSYEALSLAGTLFAMLGEGEAGVAHTREAIEAAPRRADAYYDLASTLLDLGRAEEALPWLERGTRLLGRRQDDLVDFMYAARVEALAEVGRIADAEAVLAEGWRRTDDPMHLLSAAEEVLEEKRARPLLRVV